MEFQAGDATSRCGLFECSAIETGAHNDQCLMDQRLQHKETLELLTYSEDFLAILKNFGQIKDLMWILSKEKVAYQVDLDQVFKLRNLAALPSYDNELAYFGTDIENLETILENGFPLTEGDFGSGVYLTTIPALAALSCDVQKKKEKAGILLMCRVPKEGSTIAFKREVDGIPTEVNRVNVKGKMSRSVGSSGFTDCAGSQLNVSGMMQSPFVICDSVFSQIVIKKPELVEPVFVVQVKFIYK